MVLTIHFSQYGVGLKTLIWCGTPWNGSIHNPTMHSGHLYLVPQGFFRVEHIRHCTWFPFLASAHYLPLPARWQKRLILPMEWFEVETPTFFVSGP